MRLGIVVGTRPEIIKISPIVRACRAGDIDFFLLHTGQHYSYELDGLFFEDLGVPAPRHNLRVGSGPFSAQVGQMMAGAETVLAEESPDYVLAVGDTNTVLATALVTTHLLLPFVHIESGLRSYNRVMQEEKNRVVADRVADILLPPTEHARKVLLREGYDPGKIFLTGNTIVDALRYYLPTAERVSSPARFGLEPGGYFLATVHRAENTDHPEVLRDILRGLDLASRRFARPVVLPIHPRTRARIAEFALEVPEGIRLIDPVGFYDFLVLERHAALVFTDSGGVQEECCVLRVPCLTLREDTERPETVQVGGNRLAGSAPEQIAAGTREMLDRPRDWENPFGDGNAATRIVDILRRPARSLAEVTEIKEVKS